MTRLPWMVAGVCLLAALAAGVYAWRAGGRESAALEQAADAEVGRLLAEGLAVERDVVARVARADADRLAGESAALAAERDQALAAARDARVTGAREARSEPAPATGVPLPPSAPDPGGVEPACLVRVGTPLQVRLRELELTTSLGNRVLVGSGQCVRLLPQPAEVLHDEPLRYDLAERAPEPSQSASCWTSAAVACGVCAGLGAAGGVYVGRR